MPNIIYTPGLRDLLTHQRTFDEAEYVALLERDTSTYSPSKSHETLLNQEGWQEISVASYSREVIGNVAITADTVNDRVVLDCGNVDFGSLEAGQTAKSVIVARNDGGNLGPLLRIDDDAGDLLPRALGGGNFSVHINATGLITFAQA